MYMYMYTCTYLHWIQIIIIIYNILSLVHVFVVKQSNSA